MHDKFSIPNAFQWIDSQEEVIVNRGVRGKKKQ